MLLPPRFLFTEINKRCNLRCGHCDFWQRDDDDRVNYLSRERRSEIFEELAEISPDAAVVICGGEPMLDLEEYLFVTGRCRELGLTTLSVVNGTRIRNLAMAERVMREGPDEISISLNSHVAADHDATRGVDGAFDKAVRALRLLVEARRTTGLSRRRIYVMGLIHASNYRDIGGFYDFVLNDIGADKLKLNFLQPSFGQSGEVDSFFAEHGEMDAAIIEAQIREADERHDLGINPRWLSAVTMYARSAAKARDRDRGWGSKAGTSEHICNSYERNVMVDHYGMARLCFSTGFQGMRLEKPGDLKRFWRDSEPVRRRMRRCNQFCGVSHSVRRESSTLAGRRKGEQFAERALARGGEAPADRPVIERLRRRIGL
ncbi:MAG: radical SAM protein [Flavobacteriaceae bacterium]